MKYTLLAILFSLLWASAFVVVKIGLKSSPPLFLMGSRFLLAGAVLLGWAWVRNLPRPAGREWWRLAVLGLLNNAIYLGLSGIALGHVSAGMGAIIASTNPLMLALVAPWLLKERITAVRAIGLILSFTSVSAIMYARTGGKLDDPAFMFLQLFANAVLVAGTVLFKRWAPQAHLVQVNGVQLVSAVVALLVPSLLLEPVSTVRPDLNYFGSMLYLAFAVSCGAMLIWFYLLRNGEAARANSFFFLNPVFGIFLGRVLLGEPLQPFDLIGTTGVALGIWLVQRK